MRADVIGVGGDRVAMAGDGGVGLAALLQDHTKIGQHRCIPWNVSQRLAQHLFGIAKLVARLQDAAQIAECFGMGRISGHGLVICRLGVDQTPLGGEIVTVAEPLRGGGPIVGCPGGCRGRG